MACQPKLVGISNVPDEILAAIFVKVSSLSDRFYNIGQVCRKWRHLSRSSVRLWSHLNFTDRRINSSKLEYLADDDDDDGEDDSVKSKLNYLDNSSYKMFLESADLSTGVTSVKFDIGLEKLFDTKPKFPFASCRTLEIKDQFSWTESSMFGLIACYPNLEFLSCFTMDVSLLKIICSSSIALTLQCLHLGDIENRHSTEDNLLACCDQLVKLKELSLFQQVVRSGIELLFIGLASKLEILNCKVNYQTLVLLLDSLSGQRNQSFVEQFYNQAGIDGKARINLKLKFYPNSRHLEELRLDIDNFKANVADQLVSALIRGNTNMFENIRSLDLSWIDKETMKAIVAVCSTSLQCLHLYEVKPLSFTAIWSSCANLSQLKKFTLYINDDGRPQVDDFDEIVEEQAVNPPLTLKLIECTNVNFKILISILSILPGQRLDNWIKFRELARQKRPSFTLKFYPGTRRLKRLNLSFCYYYSHADVVDLRPEIDEFQSTLIHNNSEAFQSVQYLWLECIGAKTISAIESTGLKLENEIVATF